jgi:hypothetical protein
MNKKKKVDLNNCKVRQVPMKGKKNDSKGTFPEVLINNEFNGMFQKILANG